MINILIPEETPSLNKGEAAIFAGMVESFASLEENVNVAMFSFDRETDEARYGPDIKLLDAVGIMPMGIMFRNKGKIQKILEYLRFIIKHVCFILLYIFIGKAVTKIMRRDIWCEYSFADIIIMGHDSAFAPLYHSTLIYFFKFIKKLVVIYGASLPPVNEKAPFPKNIIYSRLIKSAVNMTDMVTIRENKSLKYINELQIDKPLINLTGDFAFLLKPVADEQIKLIMNQEGLKGNYPLIGMTLSRNKIEFAFSGQHTFVEREKKFVILMAQFVEHLIETLDATVAFIPHSIVRDRERDDRIFAKEVYRFVKRKEKVKLIEKEYSPQELKGLTGKFDFCIGTRLHFIIDSVSSFVPAIALTNRADYRVHGIIGEMLGQKELIYNVENLNLKDLIEKFELTWKLRREKHFELKRIMKYVNKSTMKNGELLNELVLKKKINNS